MTKHAKGARHVSRRDTLKFMFVPAGAALSSKWLIGCAQDAATSPGTTSTTSTSSQAAQAGNGQGGALASSAPKAGASGVAGRSSTTAAGSGTQASAGVAGSTTGPLTGTAGSSTVSGGAGPSSAAGQAAAAGSGGSSVAGSTGAAGSAVTSGGTSAGTAGSAAGSGAVAGPGVMWATGGTKAMQGAYPDPFTSSGAGAACKVYPSQTLGPCYAQMPVTREDISDGLGGLPMRLSFLVVKSDGCTPVPNASVDIWHSGSQGIYSAYATGTVCNPGGENVMKDMFCRGVQLTNEQGRADFNTVFPGWYRGRTLHIHFTLRLNNQAEVTSQIYFDDTLADEILAQGDYKARGKRDTTNTSDSIFRSGGATPEQILFQTAKRPDGVLHAWKVLSIG